MYCHASWPGLLADQQSLPFPHHKLRFFRQLRRVLVNSPELPFRVAIFGNQANRDRNPANTQTVFLIFRGEHK